MRPTVNHSAKAAARRRGHGGSAAVVRTHLLDGRVVDVPWSLAVQLRVCGVLEPFVFGRPRR